MSIHYPSKFRKAIQAKADQEAEAPPATPPTVIEAVPVTPPAPTPPALAQAPQAQATLAIAQAVQSLLALAQSIQAGLAAPAAAAPLLALAPMAPAPAPAMATPEGVLPTPRSGMKVNHLINDFLKLKARSGRSDRYLRQLRVSLSSFASGRGLTLIDDITCHEIEEAWLNTQFESGAWSARTCQGYYKDVKTMFQWAVNRGYLERNPAQGVELPVSEEDEGPIAIHSPEDVSKVLEFARKTNIDVMRHLAIRYFAGVRTAECHRLREGDLKLSEDLLEVPAAKAKTRSRRLVAILPTLKSWLDLGGQLRPIGAMTVRDVIAKSKVEWPHNVARHSFISYHVAQFRSAANTALEAGNSEAMIFKHYRALVTPAQAAAFWAIRPK